MPSSELFSWRPNSPLHRFVEALGEGRWLELAILFVFSTALAIRFRFPRERENNPGFHLTWIVSILGVAWAWNLRWMSDDAFISFRYAANWVNGHGLVFNPGERVEGYTNFLWTAISALAIAFGLHPGQVSIVLTLASLVGTVWICTHLVRRLMPAGMPFIVSLAGAALAANYTFASFGTSGMETVPAAFLVLLAVERAHAHRFRAAGICVVLASLCHPDHVLFVLALGLAIATADGPRKRRLIQYAIPFFVLFVPYFLWRWAYYREFYPNTYYAKSGGKAYYSQGITYLWVSGLACGMFGAIPLAIWGIIRHYTSIAARFTLFAVPLYLMYVAKIGGDFMLGRLLCAALPPLFLMAELGARELLAKKQTVPFALAGLLPFAFTAIPNGVVRENEKYFDIADERTFYRLESFEPLVVRSDFTDQANEFLTAFQNARRTPHLGVGCIGIVGYHTGYRIMDNWGLANRSVAHMELVHRGRPGHEKLAQPGHWFEHGVDFADLPVWPEPYHSWSALRIGRFEFSIAKYDANFFADLQRAPNARVTNLEAIIRNYNPARRSNEQRACDHWFFEQIYFSQQKSDALRAELVQKLVHSDPNFDSVRDLLLQGAPEKVRNWRSKLLFGFDSYENWQVRGAAFASGPHTREARGQMRVFGHSGAFANSFHPKAFDAATGSLLSPPFVIEGQAITLRIAGGMQPRIVEVRLLIDGQIANAVTGCNTEVLSRRVIPTSGFIGKQARIEIIDAGEGNWSHVLVDDIREWQQL